MKLKNEKEIENLADAKHRQLNIASKVWTFKDGYKSGYTQAQQDLISQAREGFEEWFKNYCVSKLLPVPSREVWQAARLSMAKELEELKKENEELKKDFTHFLEKVQYVMPQNIEPEGCCNGRECGCLGKPTNPEYYIDQLRKELISKWGVKQ